MTAVAPGSIGTAPERRFSQSERLASRGLSGKVEESVVHVVENDQDIDCQAFDASLNVSCENRPFPFPSDFSD